MDKTLIRNGIVITMKEGQPPEKMDVLIEDDRILALAPLLPFAEGMTLIEAENCVVMPGLINTHTHSPMTVMRSTADNMGSPGKGRPPIFPPGQDWTGNLTPDDHYWSASLAIAEMIRSGTTTFVDMYHDMDRVAQAVIDTGMRASLGWEIITFRNDPVLWLPYDETIARKSFEECTQFAATWHGKGSGRVNTVIAPHETATCHEPWLTRSANLASQLKLPISIHIAEGKWEVDFCAEKYGLTPVEVIQKAGILEHIVIGAHSIYLTPKCIDILKGTRYSAASCLGCYIKLGEKLTPIYTLLQAGINVTLGTDGAQTNNNLNLWDEIYLVSTLPGFLANDPGLISGERALQMATLGGAKALGMEKELGSLEPGKKADIIILDGHLPNLSPMEGVLIGNLTYSSSGHETRDVLVNGKILMKDRRIIAFDEGEIMRQVNLRVRRLREEVGLPLRYHRP
jgi:5-methylthioadenosine/S-adenosylhomocysteine deaminase